jgi:hypothetical protein
LIVLQAEYPTWSDALSESMRDSATADVLQEIIDLDLDTLAAITPPRGDSRDRCAMKWGIFARRFWDVARRR